MGMADYLLSFRKWEGLDGLTGVKPVVSEEGFADRFHRYVGMEPPDPTDIAQQYGLRIPPRTSEGTSRRTLGSRSPGCSTGACT